MDIAPFGELARRDVPDLPRIEAFITDYLLHELTCPGCGKRTHPGPPPGVADGWVDELLQAGLAVLRVCFRRSRRDAGELFVAFFGEKAETSDGTIAESEKRTSEALKLAYNEARETPRMAEVVNAVEAGWLFKWKAWLWVVAPAVASA